MLGSMTEAWLLKKNKWHRVRNIDFEVDKSMLCSDMFYLSVLAKLLNTSDLYFSVLTKEKTKLYKIIVRSISVIYVKH